MKWIMIAMYMQAQSGEIIDKEVVGSYDTLEACRIHMHQKEFTYPPLPEGANAVVLYCEEVQ